MENKLLVLRLLGNMLDSEIDSAKIPDMTFIRECVSKIEEYFPKLTKSELEEMLLEIIEEKHCSHASPKAQAKKNGGINHA